jgi:hypothetical protein
MNADLTYQHLHRVVRALTPRELATGCAGWRSWASRSAAVR